MPLCTVGEDREESLYQRRTKGSPTHKILMGFVRAAAAFPVSLARERYPSRGSSPILLTRIGTELYLSSVDSATIWLQ
jgi:hypothetical protein